jgi:hypothetical protein
MTMPDITIHVISIGPNSPSYSGVVADYQVFADGDSGAPRSSAVGISAGATADEFNQTLRDAAVTLLAGFSITVSATDVQRVIGGALPTIR